MLRKALSAALSKRAGPLTPLGSPGPPSATALLPGLAAYATLEGVKDAAAKLKDAVLGGQGADVDSATPSAPAGPQAASQAGGTAQGATAAAVEGGTEAPARDEVPHAEHAERLFAGGADIPDLMPEESFAGGLERMDTEGSQTVDLEHAPLFSDADKAEAAKVPTQPWGFEEQFEDSSYKGV